MGAVVVDLLMWDLFISVFLVCLLWAVADFSLVWLGKVYLQGYRKSPSSIKTECATIVIAS